MEKIYYNPRHPAGFGGVNLLHKYVKDKYTKDEVEEFLQKSKTYRKYRQPSQVKYARVFVPSLGVCFQTDLMDMQSLSRSNKGYRYILILVDAFSRYLVALPLKSKSGKNVAEALDTAYSQLKKEGRLAPKSTLGSDLGKEYMNTDVKHVCKKHGVAQFVLRHPKKAFLAESSGRYVVERLYKYMHANNTKVWHDKLDDIVYAKNQRPNHSLGNITPANVTIDNQNKVYETLYAEDLKKIEKNKEKPLELGQRVQIAEKVLPFHKALKGYFKEKAYVISGRRYHLPGVFRYSITDPEDNMEISGTYYRQELSVIPE